MSGGPYTIMLADDQRLFVESIRRIIEWESEELVVVGVAYDGGAAVAMAQELQPDLLLLDIKMPVLDGVTVAGTLAERAPDTRVVVLTTFNDREYIEQALGHGAHGYLLKDMPPEELLTAIRAVLHGSVTVSPAVAKSLAQSRLDRRRQFESVRELYLELTKREVEVLRLIGTGRSNLEIAGVLHLGEQTVKNYVSQIYQKLEIHSRSEAIRIAHESGLTIA